MAFFNLPFSVRIAASEPVDGDRYLVADSAARAALISSGRAYEGVQCYQQDNETLYILTDIVLETWEAIGTGSGDKNFTYTQAVPATVWNINHNLGKYPSVTIYSTTMEVVDAQIDYVDTNNVTITFNNSYAGSATLN